MKNLKKRLALVVAASTPLAAQAAIDAAPVVTEISANGAQLLLIGAAILTVVYAVRAFSWARKI